MASPQAAREKERNIPTKIRSASPPLLSAAPNGWVSARRTRTTNGKDEERAEDVRILEAAGGAVELGEELAGKAEIAEDAEEGGQQRRGDPGGDDRIEPRPVLRDQRGEEAGAERQERRDGVVDRLRAEVLRLRRRHDPAGKEEQHEHDQRAEGAGNLQAEQQPCGDQRCQGQIIGRGLDEDEAAEEHRHPEEAGRDAMRGQPGRPRRRDRSGGQYAFSVLNSRNGVSRRM